MRARLDCTAGPWGCPPGAGQLGGVGEAAPPTPVTVVLSRPTAQPQDGLFWKRQWETKRGVGQPGGGWANGTEAWVSAGHRKSPKPASSLVSKDAPVAAVTGHRPCSCSLEVLARLVHQRLWGTLGNSRFWGRPPSTACAPALSPCLLFTHRLRVLSLRVSQTAPCFSL